MESVTLRFYAELNDHLPPATSREVECAIGTEEEVGSLIERCGVPMAEVDLIVVDGESVGPGYRPAPGARIGVYPVFEAFDVAPEVRIRSRGLRVIRFLVETELAPLADLLRERGYDTRLSDGPVADQIAIGRILLTTQPDAMANPGVTHCVVVEALEPMDQLREVEARLHLVAPDPLP